MAVTLSVKTKSGSIQEIQVEALVAVDGCPYGGVTVDTLRDSLIHLSGRMQAIEAAVHGQITQSELES